MSIAVKMQLNLLLTMIFFLRLTISIIAAFFPGWFLRLYKFHPLHSFHLIRRLCRPYPHKTVNITYFLKVLQIFFKVCTVLLIGLDSEEASSFRIEDSSSAFFPKQLPKKLKIDLNKGNAPTNTFRTFFYMFNRSRASLATGNYCIQTKIFF